MWRGVRTENGEFCVENDEFCTEKMMDCVVTGTDTGAGGRVAEVAE